MNYVLKVTYLSVIGGKTEEGVIQRIMAAVFGPTLSKLFNWHGKKKKRAFKNLELANVVFSKCAILLLSVHF